MHEADAVVLHVGTNHIADIARTPTLLTKTIKDHVALAERMSQLYNTPIFISSVLPRYDCEEHSIWVQQYNLHLAQAVASSQRLRIIHWDEIRENDISFNDGVHPSRSGNYFILQSLTEKLCWKLSAQYSKMLQDQMAMEIKHLDKKRADYRRREICCQILKKKTLHHYQKKSTSPITRFTGPGEDRGLHPRIRGWIHSPDPNEFQTFDMGDIAVAIHRTAVHCMLVSIMLSY